MDIHSRQPKVGSASPYHGPPINQTSENKSLKNKIMNLFRKAKSELKIRSDENTPPVPSTHQIREQEPGGDKATEIKNRVLLNEAAFLKGDKTIDYQEFERIVDFINTHKEFLFQSSSGYYRREDTGLANAIQIHAPKNPSDSDQTLVIVHLKPAEPRDDKRNVLPLNEGSEKFVKLSLSIDVDNQKLSYVATATPRGASKRSTLNPKKSDLLEDKRKFDKEIKMLERFRGVPGILQIKSHSVYPIKGHAVGQAPKTNMVLEYADGDFSNLINEILENAVEDPSTVGQWSQSPERMKYGVQLLKGLANIHRAGVVHRDIKPENLFLCGDEAKIGDFGFAVDVENSGKKVKGTPLYLSPEILNYVKNVTEASHHREGSFFRTQAQALSEQYRKTINEKTDVYSLGISLYMLKYLTVPDYLTIEGRQKGRDDILPRSQLEDHLCELQIWHSSFQPNDAEGKLIKMMTHPDPSKRISSEDALASMERIYSKNQMY